jgi:autotransporter-associated beta strand protein
VTSPQAAYSLTIQSNAQLAIAAGAALSVTTDTSVTGGGALNVDPDGTFSTGGSLTLDTGGKLTGGPVAAAAYYVDDGTASADLSGPGSLTKDTNGSVILAGVNSYTGGTAVINGALIVTNAGALPAGSSLAVGAGANTIFDSRPAAAIASAVGIAASAAYQTSPPIAAAGGSSTVPVAVSASLTSAETPATPSAAAFAARREPWVATSPAVSPVSLDALVEAGRSAVERSTASPHLSSRVSSRLVQSARPGVWSPMSDKNPMGGTIVAALDKVFAQYRL